MCIRDRSIAGPMVSLAPGYNISMACAITCDVECQNAFLPSLSFQVYNIRLPFDVKGVEVSKIVSLKFAEITFLAKPSLMLLATSIGVIPLSNSLTVPSGKLIFIMFLIIIGQR